MQEGKKSTDKWYPIILLDDTDFKTAETGRLSSDITVKYSGEGASSLSAYSLASSDWSEAGEGKYWLRLGASEFTVEQDYEVSAVCSGCLTYNFPVEVRDKFIRDMMDDVDTVIDDVADLENHGDSTWQTASGFATPDNVNDLQNHGDSTWNTATGFSTPAQVTDVKNDLINHIDSTVAQEATLNDVYADLLNHGDSSWNTADISTLATSAELTDVYNDLINHGDSSWGPASMTVQQIVDGVWNEQSSDHQVSGSFGNILGSQQEIYVNPDGSNSGDGTIANPFLDLDTAFDNSNDGAIIYIGGKSSSNWIDAGTKTVRDRKIIGRGGRIRVNTGSALTLVNCVLEDLEIFGHSSNSTLTLSGSIHANRVAFGALTTFNWDMGGISIFSDCVIEDDSVVQSSDIGDLYVKKCWFAGNITLSRANNGPINFFDNMIQGNINIKTNAGLTSINLAYVNNYVGGDHDLDTDITVYYGNYTAGSMSNTPTGINNEQWAKEATLNDVYADLQNHGDSTWQTASGFATQDSIDDLQNHGDSTWNTATGFATPANVTDIYNDLINHGDSSWGPSSVSADAIANAVWNKQYDAFTGSDTQFGMGYMLNMSHQALFNRRILNTTTNTETLYGRGADSSTGIASWAITDADGSGIGLATGIPARRSVPTY